MSKPFNIIKTFILSFYIIHFMTYASTILVENLGGIIESKISCLISSEWDSSNSLIINWLHNH